MPELRLLRLQIPPVLSVGRNLDRHLLDDREAEALEADDLLRVVREDADRREAEVGEDLVPDTPVARVGGEAELEVRLDRVEAVFLQLVCAQLVEEADPAPLLGHVQEYAALLGADAAKREVELLAAVTTHGVEDVAGQTLGMDADEHVFCPLHLPLDQSKVR